jgi:hypothetical protein
VHDLPGKLKDRGKRKKKEEMRCDNWTRLIKTLKPLPGQAR